ncbi:ASTRA-associated protein 1 [Madurella mycetomatis]|uniref:ASTRA-associated protein 1 n=1 Tax=Madurella mycetomatis TaxID=100816 RepID=A0A175VTH9_9PEZI|nr:ASTRA-associated protein 1 [Madurella mycetomatis]
MTTEGRPAHPKSILRGHKAQVHAAAFVRCNERLLTGDADGFVVAWDLTIMRPRAVWQAHTNAILGIAGWGRDRLITHGRDNKLVVWKFSADDESRLSTSLPLDPSPEAQPQPWILHMLEVNTMNFCSFTYCPASLDSPPSASPEILVAVPNTLASEAIDIFHLPSQLRRYTVKLGEKNGMVMALSLFHQGQTLTLVAGYENGQATVSQLDDCGDWNTKYQAKCHSQPILSLDISPRQDFFLTSSADAIIAKHPLPVVQEVKQARNAHPSKDENIGNAIPDVLATGKSLLSAALANETHPAPAEPTTAAPETPSRPLKTVNTKHSGQQSLRMRSDGRIFATAGWDSAVRVYSAKTLNEVAVLKWHRVGCYATAFAEIETETTTEDAREAPAEGSSRSQEAQEGRDGTGLITVPKLVELTVRDKRIRQAKTAHWLAAGSKDGKVSLWDVF